MDKGRIITLRTFDSGIEAEIIRALLESAGITSVVENDLLAGMFPSGNSWLRVKLVVAEEDEAKARAVLSAKFDRDALERDFEEQYVKNHDPEWE